MIDKSAIKQRVEEILRRRSLLEDFLEMSYEEFIEDVNTYEAALRHMQVAIQACIDIAKQIIASNGFDRPEELKDIFTILAKKNIITTDIANKLKNATGVRNILVHSYLDVDLAQIYDIMQHDLIDLEIFVNQIAQYLKTFEIKN